MEKKKPCMENENVTKEKNTVTDKIKNDFLHHRRYSLAKDIYSATAYDDYQSLALTIRDRIIEKWILTQQKYHDQNCKRVYYFSLEFLPGRLLENNIINLGLEEEVTCAVKSLGLNLEDILEKEPDPGLGNGGLGRLAACLLDSMATLGIPATGYGIRYDYGIFRQKIVDGHQVELPDEWLTLGNPWEFDRLEYTIKVKFGGKTIAVTDKEGVVRSMWVDTNDVLAVAYDIPIAGYKNNVVNNLRLWSARSTAEFDLDYFNDGDYIRACENKILSENISRVLYPSDNVFKGMVLRLKQEYFFTSASIQDIIRRYKRDNHSFGAFPEKIAIQLNDTHPAISIVELMRILMDNEGLSWQDAWDITVKTFAYTNHTIMPEALESWPVSLFESLLPRHLEIIYEINMRFLKEVAIRYPKDNDRLRRMSLIEEGFGKKVRMSHLCIVGSHSINGVSDLHSELLKTNLFKDFYELYPERFNSKTNGITQRRWLKKANKGMSNLITSAIGDGWVRDLSKIKGLKNFSQDTSFREKWRKVKYENKVKLAEYIKNHTGEIINPNSIFDVQVKRIHEYKRQMLFALYIISAYIEMKDNPSVNMVPRTAIISGKAAPGYKLAKLIINFINNVAHVINNDSHVNDKLKVVFLENYCVSLAENIFPASELSEQISTAGREASGTGNMKFMLNGALTMGTWDGANIEIAEELGMENIFIFGLKAMELEVLKAKGYDPAKYAKNISRLGRIMDLINSDFFSRGDSQLFKPLYDSLMTRDEFMAFADFESYLKAQEKASKAYLDKEAWTKSSIINTASSGKFSSDRTVSEYAKEIWNLEV